MDEGMTYIKLYRKVTENELFLELPFDKWHAFEYLLLRAKRFPTVKVIKGKPIHLDTGQLIYGEGKLATKWGWSRGKVIRFLDLLEELKMIKKIGTPYGTLITIENYSKYQCDEPVDGTSSGTSDGTHKKKEKKEKNIYSDVPEELMDAFMDFAEMRKSIKAPISTKATVTRTLNDLKKLASTTEEQIAILNQSTDRCWRGVFPLKANETPNQQTIQKIDF